VDLKFRVGNFYFESLFLLEPMSQLNTSNALHPDEALARLIAGNKRYIAGFDSPDSFKFQDPDIRNHQYPYACILGCADSRVSPEHTFDESHGNLFVARVAGNFVTPEILGSLEYGTSVLGASVILVLGHSGCGAVNAAIKAVSSQAVFDGHIGQLIDALVPAVKQARHDDHAHWQRNAVIQNVSKNVSILQSAEPILKERIKNGLLKVVGGVYNLQTGEVSIIEA
jgi:carbonic anhydrase